MECFVFCVSEAAKHDATRNNFRTKQVGDDPCRGGFVCHRIFIEFVKASRLMDNHTPERSQKVKLLKSDMEDVEKELDKSFSCLLSNCPESSLFYDCSEEENPQSTVATELLYRAITSLKQKQLERNESSGIGKQPTILVTHQFPVFFHSCRRKYTSFAEKQAKGF
jgi:hypothetical protein